MFWMFCALVVMIRATRQNLQIMAGGAALLGVVMSPSMLVDSAGGITARAVAFIGVAILVLIVGYFSPLPPKAGEEKWMKCGCCAALLAMAGSGIQRGRASGIPRDYAYGLSLDTLHLRRGIGSCCRWRFISRAHRRSARRARV